MIAIKAKTNQKSGMRITVGASNFCKMKKMEPVTDKRIKYKIVNFGMLNLFGS